MTITMYQADAFTDKLFGGNPAAVCMLEAWLPAGTMQQIAAENNLAETAFVVRIADRYEIRWFTPVVEVDLCGHATLATAHILFERAGYPGNEIIFWSDRSGELRVRREDGMLTLDFPTDEYRQVDAPDELVQGLGMMPLATYRGKTDYMAILPTEQSVRDCRPDTAMLSKLDCRGIIITAKGDEADFVSRFFGPQSGIDEDPVTGSAHTTMTPYWAGVLGKQELTARQLSARGGELWCRHLGSRVAVSGKAVTYLAGSIFIADEA